MHHCTTPWFGKRRDIEAESLGQPKKGVGSERRSTNQCPDLERICLLLRVHWSPHRARGTLTQDPSDHTLLCAESEVRAPASSLRSESIRMSEGEWHISRPLLLASLGSPRRGSSGSQSATGHLPRPVPLPPSKVLLTWDALP